MPRAKVGITLTEDTLKRLENLCNMIGLSKSQAISLAINTYIIENEKLQKTKGENREEK